MEINKITEAVIACAFRVHTTLGAGFLEKVYEKAMMIELESTDLLAKPQFPVPVFYKGTKIGDYFADILVNDCLIVELKTVENITVAHEKQLINYLAATNIENGLLINFGSSVQIKRKFKTYRPKEFQDYKITGFQDDVT
jgi:GxxExxY protein